MQASLSPGGHDDEVLSGTTMVYCHTIQELMNLIIREKTLSSQGIVYIVIYT